MGIESFRQLLVGAIFLCVIMAVVWLFRIPKRGVSAYLMAAAFVTMGSLCASLMWELASSITVALAVLLGTLLVADFVARQRYPARTGDEPS